VPAPDHESSQTSGINWPAVARILLFQVIVLLALAGAFVGYVSWSSDAAFEEFVAASKSAGPDSRLHPQSATPVMTVKGQASCPRKG
jgi:hypothetical protein